MKKGVKKFTWNPKLARQWHYVKPPGHPSKSELIIYQSYIKTLKKKKGAKVLILGSTPELRNICLANKLNTTCVDYHAENFYILKNLMKRKGKEKLMVSDWRRMNLKEKYDLILGDIAFQMIPFSDNPKVFMRLVKILKNDGFVVHRNWIRIPGAYKNLSQIVKENKKRRGKMPPFTSLAMPFVQHCFNDKKGLIYFSQVVVPTIGRCYQKGFFTRKEYRAMYLVWVHYQMPNYLPTKVKFEKLAKKYFKIKAVKSGQDWFKRFAPIYLLQKK